MTEHIAEPDRRGSAGTPHREPVDTLVATMTLPEKLSLVHGALDPDSCGQAGYLPGVPRLGIPPLRLTDGPAGIHLTGSATALPAPVMLASAFDDDLAYRYGQVLGAEGRAHGQDVLLSPMTNVIRVPYAGRNFETFSEDPLQSRRLVAAEITGIQSQGLIACVKHFAANNQEHDRQHLDVRIDEQALREVELPPFEAAVTAGVGAFMGAYNKVNGVHACHHPGLLTTILRQEWGFEGWVMSDWGATHSVDAITAGLDQEMPLGTHLDQQLQQAIETHQIPDAVLDLAAHRILTQMHRFGLLPTTPPDGTNRQARPRPALDRETGERLALEVAEHGAVLLTNDDLLPLAAGLRRIAVIGSPAVRPVVSGAGSSHVHPLSTTVPLDEIRALAGNAEVTYYVGIDLTAEPIPSHALSPAFPIDGLKLRFAETTTYSATLTVGTAGLHTFVVDAPQTIALLTIDGTDILRGSRSSDARGAIHLESGPHQVRLHLRAIRSTDRVHLAWATPERRRPDLTAAAATAKNADAAVVFVFDTVTEGFDRPDLALPYGQDELVTTIAAANPNTVVVLHAGSAVTMPWLNHVKAVLNVYYPGGMGGRATARLLYGLANPSGRLTQTFPTAETATPVAGHPDAYPGVDGVVTYHEGIHAGYRWYDKTNTPPLFGFGHGLSYTTFTIADLTVTDQTATVRLTNTGDRRGAHTVLVFIGPDPTVIAPQPSKTLAGYTKTHLHPGETRIVEITIDPTALQHWDTTSHRWNHGHGSRDIWAGSTITDLPLHNTFTTNQPIPGESAAD